MLSHDDKLAAVNVLIRKMEDAAAQDAANVAAGRPAIEKLKLVSEFCTELAKVHLQTLLVDNGVLKTIRSWIEVQLNEE